MFETICYISVCIVILFLIVCFGCVMLHNYRLDTDSDYKKWWQAYKEKNGMEDVL